MNNRIIVTTSIKGNRNSRKHVLQMFYLNVLNIHKEVDVLLTEK
jgi:hypothetical protein